MGQASLPVVYRHSSVKDSLLFSLRMSKGFWRSYRRLGKVNLAVRVVYCGRLLFVM